MGVDRPRLVAEGAQGLLVGAAGVADEAVPGAVGAVPDLVTDRAFGGWQHGGRRREPRRLATASRPGGIRSASSRRGAAEATARIEAIKIGLSVGAGTDGPVTLLLAVRRQWLSERDQAHREQIDQQAQAHADRVAAVNEHDAVERRITDLFAKAADQLGSDKGPVRLAGLYALERLAQDNPGHRQTIIDVICAYLRMPCTLPADSSARPRAEPPPRGASGT